MSGSFLEIVELPDGCIELRKGDSDNSLVTLKFSEEAKSFLQGQHVDVAKAMLSIAIQMAGRLADGDADKEDDIVHTLH